MMADRKYLEQLAARKQDDYSSAFVESILRFLATSVSFGLFLHLSQRLTPEFAIRPRKKSRSSKPASY